MKYYEIQVSSGDWPHQEVVDSIRQLQFPGHFGGRLQGKIMVGIYRMIVWSARHHSKIKDLKYPTFHLMRVEEGYDTIIREKV